MDKFFAIIEIQINDENKPTGDIQFVEEEQAAVGQAYAILGSAYQSNRPFTEVAIIDEKGHNITAKYGFKPVIDNREEKEPVYSLIDIRVSDSVRTAKPVNTQVGADAERIIMQEYHDTLLHAWNEKPEYIEAIVINTTGQNSRMEVIEYAPAPEAEQE